LAWGHAVLASPLELLADHAFLEQKAALNAMQLMTRWPGGWCPGWVETLTAVVRDEAAHLAQVTRILMRRGGKMERLHKSAYANALRQLVRKGGEAELLDRLFVSALIEARSCERFIRLSEESKDTELAKFYRSLVASENGHYKMFLDMAKKVSPVKEVNARWETLLEEEGKIIENQPFDFKIHSGWNQN